MEYLDVLIRMLWWALLPSFWLPLAFASLLIGLTSLMALCTLSGVHVVVAERTVKLTSLDASAMLWAGVAIFCVAPLAVFASDIGIGLSIALSIALSVAVWFGFRVELRAKPGSAWIVRKFLYVIPWYFKRHSEVPRFDTDGFGDWREPNELQLAFGPRSAIIVLAFGLGKNSGKLCDELGARFNQAIEQMNNG